VTWGNNDAFEAKAWHSLDTWDPYYKTYNQVYK
jgi:hypothetical protein